MDYDKNDISGLIEKLSSDRVWGLRRLAAAYLMQTAEGNSQLKRLFEENPDLIREVFNGQPWSCLEMARGKAPEINYRAEDYLRIAIPCPICDTPPDRLAWIFLTPQECAEIFVEGFEGWVTVCNQCHLQINNFNIWHTPPHGRPTEYL
jgi:hypothetical protein